MTKQICLAMQRGTILRQVKGSKLGMGDFMKTPCL